jgi:hypothetical protein
MLSISASTAATSCHVEVGAPAAWVRGQRLGDARRAFVGGGGADDLVAACGQFQRDGAPMPREAPVTSATVGVAGGFAHASSSFTSFSVAGS